MDLKHETQQNSEEKKNNISSSPKSCTDCCTTRTPLWRSGPHGPKTLCNACGIKYNKKRRERLGLEIGKKRKRSGGAGNWSSEVEEILKMRLVSFGSEVRSRKLMSKLREEEQAAILLMTLSCGSVYA